MQVGRRLRAPRREPLVHGELPRDNHPVASRFIWSRMLPPYQLAPLPHPLDEGLASHVAAIFSSAASWRSTIICVATPALTIPGTQIVVPPLMRCHRTNDVSSRCGSSMWPHVQIAGHVWGGSSRVNACSGLFAGVGTSKRCSFTQYSAHFFSMVPGSYA